MSRTAITAATPTQKSDGRGSVQPVAPHPLARIAGTVPEETPRRGQAYITLACMVVFLELS